MPGTFRLEIVTPVRMVYEGEVASLQAPGVDGYFGVLHNRAPLIAALGPGQLKFQEAGGRERFVAVTGGFFQVLKNRAVVLADDAEFAEEIDPAAAAQAATAAQERLLGPVRDDVERERLRTDLASARAKVKVAGQAKR